MTTRTHTHTRTHVVLTFANPYLLCTTCAKPVPAWHQPAKCGPGCTKPASNEPCGHLGVTSACPTWGPVDGCRCAALLGAVPHAPAPSKEAA